MTLLETSSSRTLIAVIAVVVAACLCLLFLHQIAGVPAAKQAVFAEDAPAYAELAALPAPRPGTTPVLVELFTSEGCSSCPPADALLAHLDRDQPIPTANIIVLEEHVDYWDSLGWHDRFSSHQVTARQSAYSQRLRLDDNYTPQMIVDGTDQFAGNDTAHALRAIAQAARTPKVALAVSPLAFDGTYLTGAVSLGGSGTLPPADLYAAVVESKASTEVQHGENGGRTLHHVSVVRSLQRIGAPADATTAPLKFSLLTPKDASATNLRAVVFLQREGQGAILAAASSAQTSIAAPAPSVALTQSTR
jgi:hypothetical protein